MGRNSHVVSKTVYDLGETGLPNPSNKRTGRQVPFSREKGIFVSEAVPKVFVHPDQVFQIRMTGDVSQCFHWCHRFETIPAGTETTDVVFGENASIVVELAKSATITEVRYGKTDGEVEVWVGYGFADLRLRGKLTNPEGGYFRNPKGKKSKIVVFIAKPGVRMPQVELYSNVAIPTMPDRSWLSKIVSPSEMFQSMEGHRLPMSNLAPVQRSLIPSKLYRLDTEWITSPTPYRIRIAPVVVGTQPVNVDEELEILKKQIGCRVDMAAYAEDALTGMEIMRYLICRYGNNKKLSRRKAGSPIYFTDTDYTYWNILNYPFKNRTRFGLSLIDSIMLWPKELITDCDTYSETQANLYRLVRTAEISIEIRSMPMKPDRNLYYFAYRYALDNIGMPSWDELVLHVSNENELALLPEIMGMHHVYLKDQPVTVIIDFPIYPGRWPGLSYYLMTLGITRMVITNEEDLYSTKKQHTELIFEPTQLYHDFIDWRDSLEGFRTHTVQFMGDITRTLSNSLVRGKSREHFMLSWNCNLAMSPLVMGKPVTMPVVNRKLNRYADHKHRGQTEPEECTEDQTGFRDEESSQKTGRSKE